MTLMSLVHDSLFSVFRMLRSPLNALMLACTHHQSKEKQSAIMKLGITETNFSGVACFRFLCSCLPWLFLCFLLTEIGCLIEYATT
uniref:Uncharacterized protein n=1 Tax=Arundo donax TaxID=35708 RepID=A0A0A9C5S7_ARUDO